MVATFHLHCLGHRIKYGNLEVVNATQQLLTIIRPCCSIVFIESFLFWVILITNNIGIYICIYFYNVSYIHSFCVIFNCNVFSALLAKHFEIWNKILRIWRPICFIAQSIKRCDISGCSWFFSWECFSQENCISFGLLVSCLWLSQST